MWLHKLEYIWSLGLQLIQANIEANHFLLLCTRLKWLYRIRRHGRKKCGLGFMRNLWLHLLCVLMVGELTEKLNKEAVMVHCSDLELCADKVQ